MNLTELYQWITVIEQEKFMAFCAFIAIGIVLAGLTIMKWHCEYQDTLRKEQDG
jgi:hypothetical protein